MNLKSVIAGIFGSSAAKAAVSAAGSALTQAVAAAAQSSNPIGAAALAAVQAAEAAGGDGAAKKAAAVAAVKPVLIAELAKGGLAAIVSDAEQFAGMVVEEVLAQLKTTSLLSLAAALLKILVA